MLFLVFLPVIPAIWLIATRSPEDALLDVYLPVLFFVPTYYVFEIHHVIGFSAADAALLPIVAAAIVKHRRQWRWRRADLWLMLFACGYGYSMAISYSTGSRAFVEILISAVCPYIVGKLLIENADLRRRFVRRLTWLAAVVAFLSVVEFRLSKNLFTAFYSSLFGRGSPNIEQIRHGLTRTQGPFEHAIAAGMVFTTVWIFALWQRNTDRRLLGDREPRFFGIRRSTVLMAFSFLGMCMAMSRGPWMGAIFAFAIYRIAPAKNVKRTAITIGILLVIVGAAGYSALKVYTSGTTATAASQEQENAIYRRQLLEAYDPIAEQGGLFGWGLRIPFVAGQPSIDNHYLMLRLRQGSLGLVTFLLLALEAAAAMMIRAMRTSSKEEFSFAIVLLAVLSGILLTISTVTLQAQEFALFYLCVGWAVGNWQQDRAITPEPEAIAIPETPRIFA